MISSGTISFLFAEHSIVHSFYVIKAWKRLYKRYPRLWQIVCILLHDIGYLGTDFISIGSNEHHELLGARICKKLFGQKGYDLVFGHRSRNRPISLLEAPDDYSWCLAPVWWMQMCYLLQRKKTNPGSQWKLWVCERWIRRFNGEGPTSIWDSLAIKGIRREI